MGKNSVVDELCRDIKLLLHKYLTTEVKIIFVKKLVDTFKILHISMSRGHIALFSISEKNVKLHSAVGYPSLAQTQNMWVTSCLDQSKDKTPLSPHKFCFMFYHINQFSAKTRIQN